MTKLRDKDVAVLQAIENGASTVTEIRESTTLTTRQINYSIDEYSLEKLGLVDVDRESGREWREVNGHQKNVWKSKQVQLTDKGIQLLAELETVQGDRYEDMSKQELIERVLELEERQDRFEQVFKDFRSKVMERI